MIAKILLSWALFIAIVLLSVAVHSNIEWRTKAEVARNNAILDVLDCKKGRR